MKNTRFTQQLSSGLLVRQDFAEAVRPVFFQTEFDEFLYATHGGTLFLVSFRGRVYGLTCNHVFKDFRRGALFVAQEKYAQKGSKPAPVAGVYYPSSPVDAAEGTDVVDVCVIEFDPEIGPEFFKESAYVLDEKTAATGHPGHRLLVAGVLKEKTTIDPPFMEFGYCRLEFQDAGSACSDPTLREAIAEFAKPEFNSVTGISGSPVFDLTANALCGMVMRGGMCGNRCRIHFADIFDVMRLLEAINDRRTQAYYFKNVLRLVPTAS